MRLIHFRGGPFVESRVLGESVLSDDLGSVAAPHLFGCKPLRIHVRDGSFRGLSVKPNRTPASYFSVTILAKIQFQGGAVTPFQFPGFRGAAPPP